MKKDCEEPSIADLSIYVAAKFSKLFYAHKSYWGIIKGKKANKKQPTKHQST